MTDCRVVPDGEEDDIFLYCHTCNREVCCGHHLTPHDEDGCHGRVHGDRKCQCRRRVKPAADVEREAQKRTEQEVADRAVSQVIAPAITAALNGVDQLISQGTITQEQAATALESFPDFADAWEEYIA